MNPIDIIEKAYSILKDRTKSKKQSILSKLKEIEAVCNMLVQEEIGTSDNAILLHECSKKLYEAASGSFAGSISEEELNIVIKALASTRIYYWAKRLDGIEYDEVRSMLSDYQKPSRSLDKEKSEQRSYKLSILPESLVNLMVMIKPAKNTGELQKLLNDIKQFCLSDIADLNALSLKYV